MKESFNPLDYDFVLLPKLKQQTLDFYEFKNHAGADGSHDFLRMNIYLAKDYDFVNIWYGSVDAMGVQVFFDKHGIDFDHEDEKLFRGYITTKEEADVILPALRLDSMYSPSVYLVDDEGKPRNENLT